MFLSGALFVLFLAGCWLLCLTDAATTPAAEFPGLSKRGWIAIIAVTFIAGAIAWYLTSSRRPPRPRGGADDAAQPQHVRPLRGRRCLPGQAHDGRGGPGQAPGQPGQEG